MTTAGSDLVSEKAKSTREPKTYTLKRTVCLEFSPNFPSSSSSAWHLGDMKRFILAIKHSPARLDSTVTDSDTPDLENLPTRENKPANYELSSATTAETSARETPVLRAPFSTTVPQFMRVVMITSKPRLKIALVIGGVAVLYTPLQTVVNLPFLISFYSASTTSMYSTFQVYASANVRHRAVCTSLSLRHRCNA